MIQRYQTSCGTGKKHNAGCSKIRSQGGNHVQEGFVCTKDDGRLCGVSGGKGGCKEKKERLLQRKNKGKQESGVQGVPSKVQAKLGASFFGVSYTKSGTPDLPGMHNKERLEKMKEILKGVSPAKALPSPSVARKATVAVRRSKRLQREEYLAEMEVQEEKAGSEDGGGEETAGNDEDSGEGDKKMPAVEGGGAKRRRDGLDKGDE